MLCAISGEAPQEPVVSKLSGNVFERRLIEKFIEQNGKDPISGEELSLEDLLPLRSARVVRPRPPTFTSIPALLSTFQNEWDALALETYSLSEQLKRTREELSTALYQNDAAVRVIARLQKERDEARDALSKVSAAPAAVNAAEDAMAVDDESMPEKLQEVVDATQGNLSKSRKKRPVPEGWATPDEVAAFEVETIADISIEAPTSVSVFGLHAVVGGMDASAAALYSISEDRIERTMHLEGDDTVTCSIWTASDKLVFGTAKGYIEVYENGNKVNSFKAYDGPVNGIAMHPSGEILACIGEDQSFSFYHLASTDRVTRVTTTNSLYSCAFHPDGHIFAAGTDKGTIRLFMTKTGEEAASFSLDTTNTVISITFSENGYWFAAAAGACTKITVFDLRKEGDAARAKVIDIGSQVKDIAWDYSQQFLATAGEGGITVQQYNKSGKKWSEILRKDVEATAVAWGKDAKILVAVGPKDHGVGVVAVLAKKD